MDLETDGRSGSKRWVYRNSTMRLDVPGEEVQSIMMIVHTWRSGSSPVFNSRLTFSDLDSRPPWGTGIFYPFSTPYLSSPGDRVMKKCKDESLENYVWEDTPTHRLSWTPGLQREPDLTVPDLVKP